MSEKEVNNPNTVMETIEINDDEMEPAIAEDLTTKKVVESTAPLAPEYDLSQFKMDTILNNNTNRKMCILVGKFLNLSEENRAIIILEKTPFSLEYLKTKEDNQDENNSIGHGDEKKLISYFSDETTTKTEFINDIYGNFQWFPNPKINGIKTTIIYPATEKHIEKYTINSKFLIKETPALYENITLPYLNSSQLTIDWVYNILEHKQEVERIVYEDPDPENGFVLLPDLKWDGCTRESLYMLALPHKHGIKSLRDLNSTHLPLLRNIRDKGCQAIEQKYDLKEFQLRIYIHYQPSFYHLHIHFNALSNDAPGIFCEKSHILDTVINNIEMMGDYYQKATLPFIAFHGQRLLEKFLPELNPTCVGQSPKKRIKYDQKN